MLKDALLVLLDEVYISEDYRSTWFKDNDPNSSFLPSLEVLSAEIADRHAPAGRNTVAGHAAHLATALEATAKMMRGEGWEIDWEASWGYVQPLGEPEWDDLRTRIRNAYNNVRAEIEEATTIPADQVLGALALLAHSAYHLGAIRQLAGDVLPHATPGHR